MPELMPPLGLCLGGRCKPNSLRGRAGAGFCSATPQVPARLGGSWWKEPLKTAPHL